MKKKIISLIVAQENIENIYESNKILIEQLLKKFAEVYILNLYNLKIFTTKNLVTIPKNLPEQLKIEKIEFCKKLKEKRLALNYTQEYMAEQLNISLRTYQKMEKDFEVVNFERIISLMKFMNLN